MGQTLPPAAVAFDAVADQFDERYGGWKSVAAQRRVVRTALLRAFPPGSRLLEMGGGTGDDALWLADQSREVQMTDVSPSMIRVASARLVPRGLPAPLLAPAERLDIVDAALPFDGAFSNFAGLNCVSDLAPVGRELARLVKPGGRVLLVMFGVCPPGEWVVQVLRGNVRAVARRAARGDVAARLGGREFVVRYHRQRDIVRALAPHFRLTGKLGVGVFVPPSAAEPWISQHSWLLGALERLDRMVARPLAVLGDHVLYAFERTLADAPERTA